VEFRPFLGKISKIAITQPRIARLYRGTAEVVQWSKSTSGKIWRGCASGGLTLDFATHLVYAVMPFNRYATIQDTWACGRFVYVRFVTVFRFNSCLCANVISVDSVLATTHASIVHSHAKWQMMTAVLRVWLRNCRLITSFYCFTLLVLHIPLLFLWSCIFRCWYLVLNFQVLHF